MRKTSEYVPLAAAFTRPRRTRVVVAIVNELIVLAQSRGNADDKDKLASKMGPHRDREDGEVPWIRNTNTTAHRTVSSGNYLGPLKIPCPLRDRINLFQKALVLDLSHIQTLKMTGANYMGGKRLVNTKLYHGYFNFVYVGMLLEHAPKTVQVGFRSDILVNRGWQLHYATRRKEGKSLKRCP